MAHQPGRTTAALANRKDSRRGAVPVMGDTRSRPGAVRVTLPHLGELKTRGLAVLGPIPGGLATALFAACHTPRSAVRLVRMVELRLHRKPVHTVFDLLGDREDDITYSVGWGLSQSDLFSQAVLATAYGKRKITQPVAIRLQEFVKGQGRTDIEIETEELHVIIEAKRGWALPDRSQLKLYVPRLKKTLPKEPLLLVLSESSAEWVTTQDLPESVDGIPVRYLSWSDIASLATSTASKSRTNSEKRLLRELHRYLKGLMNMQDVTSNLAYVVSLGTGPLYDGGPSFESFITEKNVCFQPVGGGKGGWPVTPPNYLGFRFDGRLQQIRHVESYEIHSNPWDVVYPGIGKKLGWTNSPHFFYKLGPVIEPSHPVRTGGLYGSGRHWCAIDLLLTCESVREARDKTQARLDAAGE